MKLRLILIVCLTFITGSAYSQGFNEEKTALANFLRRMYNTTPFEGVKVVEDYDTKYFISIVVLEKSKYSDSSDMMRVSQVKAQSQANIFFNGSQITSDLIIRTSETKVDENSTIEVTEIIESIKESATGFVKNMELLINFESEGNRKIVFIYFRELII